ncbi:MAG: cadmium-containing carbonic anhydrase [Nitrosomonas ureae]
MFESLKNLLKHFTGSQESASATPGTSTQQETATSLTTDEESNAQYITLGQFNLGIGSIGPDNRNDIDRKILNEMYQAISAGLFNVPVNGSVPEICVDGRTDKSGHRKSAPCAAGGTLSIVYGGDLGSNSAATDINEEQLTTQTINKLKEKGHQTGVHGDDHSDCGCGACSKAPTIYQHIAERINDLASLTNQLGIDITGSEKESIVQQAKNRLNQAGFFAENRASIIQAAQNTGAAYEELAGQHNELGIALNTRAGTTVDRSAIRSKYGPQYDMFVVDAWAFGNAAKDINSTANGEDEQRIAKAITLQNVATASILGHGSLPIIPIA